ncbi:hypothetical protein F7725_005233 [Dissostichus mawsoni]|uniref:Secernin-2 n=1 Tax=Dissostichus mawsoni TaxID=36200 RepID=A0A7J5YUP6_DISMA|nr:hypothetical protein F7725_005233 [Dissostichus mawsoni]
MKGLVLKVKLIYFMSAWSQSRCSVILWECDWDAQRNGPHNSTLTDTTVNKPRHQHPPPLVKCLQAPPPARPAPPWRCALPGWRMAEPPRPSPDEVQEVGYHPAAPHPPGSMLECTYIQIPQVEQTHAVVLSKPAWMWGAEMGANDQGVCIGTRLSGPERPSAPERLYWAWTSLGLERGDNAWGALTVITSLLEQHGQGGPCREDPEPFSYHNTFLLVDRNEAWVLETAGRLWVAQKFTEGVKNISNQLTIGAEGSAEHPELRSVAQAQGWWDGEGEFNFSQVFSPENPPARMELAKQRYRGGTELLQQHDGSVTAEVMMSILRDKPSGICMDSGGFCTTGSMVSVLPRDSSLPCIHFFTATPDPSRYFLSLPFFLSCLSLYESPPTPTLTLPFVFSDCSTSVLGVVSPQFGPDDPVRKQPRFQSQVDRRHELYKAHQVALSTMETNPDEGLAVYEILRDLESQCLTDISAMLNGEIPGEELGDLFFDSVDTEIKFYQWTSLTQSCGNRPGTDNNSVFLD